jgi:hypothetical protein
MFKGQGFRVLLDVRDAEPFTPDVAGVWVHIGREARARGMVKCARLVGSQGWREVAQRVAREAGNDDLVMDFTDEATAVHWLTHATSRSLT